MHSTQLRIIAILFTLCTGTWAQTTNSGADLLGTQGAEIRNNHGSGNVVRLRGVNLGGWLEWQDWMGPMDSSQTIADNNPGHNGYDFELRRLLAKRFDPTVVDDLISTYEDAWITETDLDNIKALNLNAIRLTFGYDTLLNEDGTWRKEAFTRLDWLVQKAWDRGIYTIIDFHAFLPPGANQDGSTTGYWSNAAQKEETAQIWAHIAEHFRGNSAVAMYDLLNEPNNSAPKGKSEPKAALVCDLYDKIYHAIRATDSDHIIVMEGIWDWKALRDPQKAGYTNIVYSMHWYHFGANGAAQNALTDKDVQNAVKMEQQWKIPCFIGEFNLFGNKDAWEHAIQAYDSANLSWTEWTYKNKASGDNSWGVYTTLPSNVPPVPNLLTDSDATIRTKWKAWETRPEHFQLNPLLGPVLKSP